MLLYTLAMHPSKLLRSGLFLTYSTLSFNPKGSYIAIGDSSVTFWDFQNKIAGASEFSILWLVICVHAGRE